MCLTFPAECVYIFTHRAIRAEGQWVTTATADGIDYLGDRQWWERMDEAVFVLFCFFPRRALDFSSLAVSLPFTTRGDYHSLCSKKERWKEMCAHVFQHLGQRCGRCSVHSSQLISCCQDVNRLLPSFFFLFHHCSDSFCFSSCCSEPDQAPSLEQTSIMTIPMSSLKILGLLSFKKKKSQLIQILPQIIIICNNWSRWRSTSPSPLYFETCRFLLPEFPGCI